MMTRNDIIELFEWVDMGCPTHSAEEQEAIQASEDADWEAFALLENGPVNHGFLSDGLSPEERQAGIVPFHVALEDARADEARAQKEKN